MSTGYDYTRDGYPQAQGQHTQANGGGGKSAPADDSWNPNDYSFLGVEAAPDVEAIEREAESREFREIEPGDHELVVKGFKGKPVAQHRTGYLRGVQVSWECDQVAVRLAMVGDPGASTLDFFDLPPRDAKGQQAYLFASKTAAWDNPGFMARKFVHFLNRIGFAFAEGQPIPPEACNLGNWVGRRVHATMVVQKADASRINQTTGLPYPPRSQVKLFSYRPAGTSTPQQAPIPGNAMHPTARPLVAQRAGPGSGGPLVDNGLDNI